MSSCDRCGRPEPGIPGHPGHECTAPIGGTSVRPGRRVEHCGLIGEVVLIDRTLAQVHWPSIGHTQWLPLDDVAEWLVAS